VPPCDVGRSHSPNYLKPLEAGGRGGGHGVGMCCLLYVVGCVVPKVTVGKYLSCRTVFLLVIFVLFFGELQSQIFYILRFQ